MSRRIYGKFRAEYQDVSTRGIYMYIRSLIRSDVSPLFVRLPSFMRMAATLLLLSLVNLNACYMLKNDSILSAETPSDTWGPFPEQFQQRRIICAPPTLAISANRMCIMVCLNTYKH